jgi:hypothetical protein
MTNFIGFLLPAAIDLINRRIKDKDIRFWFSVLVCILIGSALVTVETNAFNGLDIKTIAELIAIKSMAMFGMSQLTYKQIWENSNIRGQLNLDAKINAQ